jgi:hypothetical protein
MSRFATRTTPVLLSFQWVCVVGMPWDLIVDGCSGDIPACCRENIAVAGEAAGQTLGTSSLTLPERTTVRGNAARGGFRPAGH